MQVLPYAANDPERPGSMFDDPHLHQEVLGWLDWITPAATKMEAGPRGGHPG